MNDERSGEIIFENKGYYVILYEKGKRVRSVDVTNMSLRYASDALENWIDYIIK